MISKSFKLALGAAAIALGTGPAAAQFYDDWGQHGPWTYKIGTGCTMQATLSDKDRASVKLHAIGDELRVTLSDERWPRDALRAMTEGQDYRATMAIDQGSSVIAIAERSSQWGYITLTTHTDQLARMSAGRTLRYQVGSSPVVGEFAIRLSASALEKYRECDEEAGRRNDADSDEWLNRQ